MAAIADKARGLFFLVKSAETSIKSTPIYTHVSNNILNNLPLAI